MKLLENTGIRECVLEEIRSLAQRYGIEKVILFGSRARGDFIKPAILISLPVEEILLDFHWM